VLLVGSAADPDTDDPGLNWFKIAIGVLFLVMAARQWTKRPPPGEEAEKPAWMTSIETATPRRAALLGAIFSGANPKNLALTLAASASIAEAGLDGVDTGIALAAVRDFMSDNNAVIKMVVLLLLGATMLGDGLAALWR
jgi:threonine/homoserine/homoserine lactone efflux protein